MSNAVSALNGVSFTGIAKIEEAGLQGMITLRGDFASQGFKDALKKLTGRVAPKTRETYAAKGRRVLWMSPDELMILTDYASVQDDLATLTDALSGEHALAVNVSDARAFFRITGESAREVIGKLAPVDMGAFEVGCAPHPSGAGCCGVLADGSWRFRAGVLPLGRTICL